MQRVGSCLFLRDVSSCRRYRSGVDDIFVVAVVDVAIVTAVIGVDIAIGVVTFVVGVKFVVAAVAVVPVVVVVVVVYPCDSFDVFGVKAIR